MRERRVWVCEHHKKVLIDTCPLCKIAKLNKENKALREEMHKVVGDYKMHPFWKTAPREKILETLRFQGCMTRSLLPHQDESFELQALLAEARRAIAKTPRDATIQKPDLCDRIDQKLDELDLTRQLREKREEDA